MATLTLTATGSNTVTTTTGIAADGHRDYLVWNDSEHTIIINILGSVTANDANQLVSWRDLEGDPGIPGTRSFDRGLIIGPGEYRQVSVHNRHTALQQINFTAVSAHAAGTYVGDTVHVTTLNTAQSGAVN